MKQKKAKVIARIFGGLGNQLFCYAAARRLALISDAELALDHKSGFAYDSQYKRRYQLDHFHIPCRKATAKERLEPLSRPRRWLMRRRNLSRPFSQRDYLRQEVLGFDARLMDVRPRGTLYLEGYWQSEKYFEDIEETVRSELRMLPPDDPTNFTMAKQISSTRSISVHVRFFDPVDQDRGNNAPAGYYTRAVNLMESLVPEGHYFLFSDQPAAARARFPLPDERVTLVNHNQTDSMAFADLWLMSQCQHHIIANSTFSWWGAWLASHSGKCVIAPGFEIHKGVTSWGIPGMLPDGWIKI